MKISPSILSANFLDFNSSIAEVVDSNALHSMHIDVMDGTFVPNITMGHDLVKAIKKQYPKLLVDTHLMIVNPENHVDHFIDAETDFLSFHIEVSREPKKLIKYIQSKNVKAGIAINPATNLETLKDILGFVDFVLVMSVNPGFSGQKFIESSYDKVKELKQFQTDNLQKNKSFRIELDGGVNIKNIKALKKVGVDTVVAGNAVFGQNDPRKALDALYKEANA